MKTELELTLRLRSPIALHRTRASIQYVETLDYIPGVAVRGALAETYLSERGKAEDDTFQKLFVSGQVQYGDLWPTVQSNLTHGSILIPATAQACKRYGLTHKDSFRDTLLDVFAQTSSQECGYVDSGDKKKCKEPRDRVNGYLSDLECLERVAAKSELRVSAAMGSKHRHRRPRDVVYPAHANQQKC